MISLPAVDCYTRAGKLKNSRKKSFVSILLSIRLTNCMSTTSRSKDYFLALSSGTCPLDKDRWEEVSSLDNHSGITVGLLRLLHKQVSKALSFLLLLIISMKRPQSAYIQWGLWRHKWAHHHQRSYRRKNKKKKALWRRIRNKRGKQHATIRLLCLPSSISCRPNWNLMGHLESLATLTQDRILPVPLRPYRNSSLISPM